MTIKHPANPLEDIPWGGNFGDIVDIAVAFTHARRQENVHWALQIPDLTLPAQSQWDTMDDGMRALWLINRERIDRGIHPLEGLEKNVTAVAQRYAEYLRRTGQVNHTADGRTPWQRLEARGPIQRSHDFLPQVENLAAFWSTDPIPLPVERAIYAWLYDDSSSQWMHRTAVLQYPFNDNSGKVGAEGFLGIGRASGPMHYQGRDWTYAEVIVMNVFDPGADWIYS